MGTTNVTGYMGRLVDTQCFFVKFYVLHSPPDASLVYFTIVVVVVNALVSLLGTLLNAFVLAAYLRNKRLRTAPNMLLMVLGCSDLLVSAVAHPTFIVKKLSVIFSSFHCFLWAFNRLLFYGTCGFSLCVISILSIERFITLRYPYHHEHIVTRKRLKTAVILSILFILLLYGSQALGPPYEVLAVIGALVIFFNVALVVIIWLWIHRLIRRHKSNIETHQTSFQTTTNRTRILRSTKTSYLIVGGVLLCYVPNFFGHVYFSVKPDDFEFFCFVTPWLDTLALGNSVLNPVILFKRKRNFRETVKVFFGVSSNECTSE